MVFLFSLKYFMFNPIIFLETTGLYGSIDIRFDMSMSSKKDVQYQPM